MTGRRGLAYGVGGVLVTLLAAGLAEPAAAAGAITCPESAGRVSCGIGDSATTTADNTSAVTGFSPDGAQVQLSVFPGVTLTTSGAGSFGINAVNINGDSLGVGPVSVELSSSTITTSGVNAAGVRILSHGGDGSDGGSAHGGGGHDGNAGAKGGTAQLTAGSDPGFIIKTTGDESGGVSVISQGGHGGNGSGGDTGGGGAGGIGGNGGAVIVQANGHV